MCRIGIEGRAGIHSEMGYDDDGVWNGYQLQQEKVYAYDGQNVDSRPFD